MDGKIAEWIIEFLLRQNIDDHVLNSLLSTLPFPTDDPCLKKSLLLRRIGSDVSNKSVDENILDLLEILEELDFRKSKPVLESMKAAYCAVAVDCTVRHLEEKTEDIGKYIATVKRVWRERVSKLEKSERKSGLVSENLVQWKGDIFAAVWECDVRTRILSINTRNEALNSLRAYLAEAWRDMGPSFLELAAKRMHEMGKMGEKIDGDRSGAIVVFNGQSGHDMAADSANMDCGGLEKEQYYQVDEPTSENEETQKVHASVKTKHVAGLSRPKLRKPRSAKIVGEVDEDISINKDSGLTHPPEVSGMQEKGGLEFHFDVFKNIASVARRGAKNVNVPSTTRENPSQREEVQRSYPDVNDKDAGEAPKRNETNPEVHAQMGSPMSRTRASLMDRNSSAKTYRWEDSPSADSLGASPTQSSTPNGKRRVKRRWSPVEEETLREGVNRFGKGNWKLILNAFHDVFEGRTEVDLKDKWRNLTK